MFEDDEEEYAETFAKHISKINKVYLYLYTLTISIGSLQFGISTAFLFHVFLYKSIL
jgi:hypothetical protein